ncbi:MAG: tRNA pseudouridine(38-40) synthase TruA [Acidobacteria bacterium]|nr:tRNA pseudouridine(38-40) synthase TruA [Acidobacteriota bacterium]
MSRYRLDLAYEGTGFRGYARQPGLRTIQGELEDALERVLGGAVETAVAGRTDAGVHARGQVVSFDADGVDPRRLRRSLNGIVGAEISVKELVEVDVDFDARFSAKWRRYRYVVDQSSAADPLDRHRVWHVGRELDVPAMRSAIASIIGEHDFSSFCRAIEGKTNVRRVEEAAWNDLKDGKLEFWIRANAFCQQMVRSVVGFCYDVGRGFSQAEAAESVLAARDRSAVATVAPPHGLTLWEVGY